MIEFTGYLTGAAKKAYYRRVVKYLRNTFLVAAGLVFPFVLLFALRVQRWGILIGYSFIILAIIFSPYLQIKADKNKYVPKRICIQDGILLSVADKATESKSIDEVKKILDCGEFYVILFPFGKYSEKFVCQKDLLTKGTLEEFETLFEGKIVRKIKTN